MKPVETSERSDDWLRTFEPWEYTRRCIERGDYDHSEAIKARMTKVAQWQLERHQESVGLK